MLMYSSIEYGNNYLKAQRSLYQFCRDVPHATITDSQSFKFKSRLLDNINNAGIINAEIAVPLEYLLNFWKTLEMPLINCEINLILPYSER